MAGIEYCNATGKNLCSESRREKYFAPLSPDSVDNFVDSLFRRSISLINRGVQRFVSKLISTIYHCYDYLLSILDWVNFNK